MEKAFYRVANVDTGQGLWYNRAGEFTGLIHSEFSFCGASVVKMPHDPEIVGYLSVTDSLAELLKWFSKADLFRLQNYGYRTSEYLSSDFKFYSCNSHYVIAEASAVFVRHVDVFSETIQHQSI